MVIKRLALHNFGIYAGDNQFDFNGSKPVVLIGGMNGRGKTTFLEAVLLALYGSNSFAYNESTYKTYTQYLKSYVNRHDGTLETSIELTFVLDNEEYVVRRSWNGGQRVKENIQVWKDGIANKFLTENWSLFIENILPSGISNFFFFDGEKIAELAVENTNAKMKAAIKALLGITVLDGLSRDIKKLITKVEKEKASSVDMQELSALRKTKETADAALANIDAEIAENTAALETAHRTLEKIQHDYSSKGGDIAKQNEALLEQRTTLISQHAAVQEELISMAAGELPLCLVKDLLLQIRTQASKEQESKILNYAVEQVSAAYKEYMPDEMDVFNNVADFVSFFGTRAQKKSTEIIYNLSDWTTFQLKGLIRTNLDTAKNKAKDAMNRSSQIQKKTAEIESYLNVNIDEKTVHKLFKKMKTQEQIIIELEVKNDRLSKARSNANGEAIRANSAYNKCVENVLSRLELNDDSDRILKYSYNAEHILEVYKQRLQKRKIGSLAETMTSCYKQLANKKNLIDRIEIDSGTLDFSYLNSMGVEVPKRSLSAGEKQLMVISLLWALAICSKRKLPVIIDTPLSRLDTNHRVSLITTYFPNASEQTIILSTDSEIDRANYALLKDNIGDEFTLEYNDELKRTQILRGYFIGDDNDN